MDSNQRSVFRASLISVINETSFLRGYLVCVDLSELSREELMTFMVSFTSVHESSRLLLSLVSDLLSIDVTEFTGDSLEAD